MDDIRRISEEYQKICNELIEEMPEFEILKTVTIICLASELEKKTNGKVILGQTEKISAKYKWGIPCDFTITFFEPNISHMTNQQLRILMYHELLHVGVEDDRLFIRPHDLEDFKAVIEQYGVSWAE